jgi:methylglutamate dehydrogenase subunit B
MFIPCPFCGERESAEFVVKGDAAPKRPADLSEAAFVDYVYLRDNPAGKIQEYWYHAAGCRNWLVVTRDSKTHEILESRLAMPEDER